jgi:hypothetical protein
MVQWASSSIPGGNKADAAVGSSCRLFQIYIRLQPPWACLITVLLAGVLQASAGPSSSLRFINIAGKPLREPQEVAHDQVHKGARLARGNIASGSRDASLNLLEPSPGEVERRTVATMRDNSAHRL